jgi:hypothetical protein
MNLSNKLQIENRNLTRLQGSNVDNAVINSIRKRTISNIDKLPEDNQNTNLNNNIRDWTVLCYFSDSSRPAETLEESMVKGIEGLKKAGTDNKIAFVSQVTRISKDGEVERAVLKSPGTPQQKDDFTSLGKIELTDPQNFKDFLSFGMNKFPAKHYMVIMKGHGDAFKGMLVDADRNALSIPQIASVLKEIKQETGNKIDVLNLDSCLMGNAEMIEQVKDTVRFVVASEEECYTDNLDYERLGKFMDKEANGDGLTTKELLKELQDNMFNEYITTSSAIDCSKMNEFDKKLDDFSEKILKSSPYEDNILSCFKHAQHYAQTGTFRPKRYLTQMRDIGAIAKNIINNERIEDKALKASASELLNFIKEKLIVFEQHSLTHGVRESTGLSIYAPITDVKTFIDEYSQLDLAKNTKWDDVLRKYGSNKDINYYK